MTPIADEFERIHAEFAEALAACRVKASSTAIHRLRKTTRTTEALLRKSTEDHPGARDLCKRVKKAEKELKRIRRAVGPVRDLAVHRKIAKEMRNRALKSALPKTRQLLMGEHTLLDAKLSRRREAAQKNLRELLAKREIKMERALEKTAKAMRALHNREPGVLVTAKGWMQRAPLPTMEPESLHDYRKITKAARYLAGMDEGSAAALKLEKRLERTQDAIGKWHDLLLLTEEAKALLGGGALITLAVRDAQEKALRQAARSIGLNK